MGRLLDVRLLWRIIPGSEPVCGHARCMPPVRLHWRSALAGPVVGSLGACLMLRWPRRARDPRQLHGGGHRGKRHERHRPPWNLRRAI